MKPIIFNYLDYRHYLSDLFESAKQEKAGFSYRELARIAGSSSPNFLQLIINRKLNIQGDAVRALSEWIGLTNKEGLISKLLSLSIMQNRTRKKTNTSDASWRLASMCPLNNWSGSNTITFHTGIFPWSASSLCILTIPTIRHG